MFLHFYDSYLLITECVFCKTTYIFYITYCSSMEWNIHKINKKMKHDVYMPSF